jgi:hypothetical protein
MTSTKVSAKRGAQTAEEASVSRRRMLRAAGSAAIGTVAAGFFLRDADATRAAGGNAEFDSVKTTSLDASIVEVSNSWGGSSINSFFKVVNLANEGKVPAIQGESNSRDGVGVYGAGWNGGTGVSGVGRVGVFGITGSPDAWIGIWGRHTGNGPGVAGDSGGGPGIVGNSTSGYGAQFEGGKAQLRLVPKSTTGKPRTGAHSKGEIYMDSNGAIFVCVKGGTPGTWRKVTTSAT